MSRSVPCRVMELRAGEGGADARAFAQELAQVYRKLALRRR